MLIPGKIPAKKGHFAVIPSSFRSVIANALRFVAYFVFAAPALLVAGSGAGAAAEPVHGIAMHGKPALPANIANLPYANPDAPKGGRIAYGFVGTFDSLNPFILKGNAPRGLHDSTLGNNVFESLMMRSRAEPFTLYGLIAETVEMPGDRGWIEFHLNAVARFSDGAPITADDVVFSFEILRDKGRPKGWYKKVAAVEKIGERSVRFTFTDDADREIPLIVGLMPVLPKHATDPDVFARSGLTPLIGSGPYVFGEIKPGTRVTLKRNPDYWAKDLPVKRGFDNFDEIRIEYIRDANSHFEAFKKGLFDILPDGDPARLSSAYTFPAVADGRVVLEPFKKGTPSGMNAFVFNTRRAPFDDPLVREALTYFFDFEWFNRNLFFDRYERTGSFFHGSDLSALGRPASEDEKALLKPFPGVVTPGVMDGTYKPPVSDGSGRDRKNLRTALKMLGEAGYARKGNALVHTGTGKPLSFEFLTMSREQERLALAFQRTLSVAGIEMSVRQVDATQFWDRLKQFDYDMIQFFWAASLSPGNEQNFRWSRQSAGTPGTFNFAGANEAAIDAMIAALLAARSREDFVTAVRALDRILMSGIYVVPLFHLPDQWVARWTRIAHPDKSSLYGYEPTTWWSAE
jgi:peptide/nickel transport system substrate-binding protein